MENSIDNIKLNRFDQEGLQEAYDQALLSRSQGGIPIGAALALNGTIVARGHNKRVQENSMIKHGETDCIENTARRLSADDLKRCTLYTSLSPCYMCAGTVLLFGIPRIVIGENKTFEQSEALLREKGCELIVANDTKFITLMRNFIRENPSLWGEDIGKSAAEILQLYHLDTE